jgi:hypothetical protein
MLVVSEFYFQIGQKGAHPDVAGTLFPLQIAGMPK